MEEVQNKLDALENHAKSLELDIQSTQEQIYIETDGTHIVFLNDHLRVLKYELNKAMLKFMFCGGK